MKVLAIGNYYEPEITSGIYLVKNLYEQLADNGVEVEVIIPSPSRGISQKLIKEYYGKDEVLKGDLLHISRIKIYPEKKGVIRRALRYGLIQYLLYKRAKSIKADIVFSQSTPPIIGITAAMIAKRNQIPFVYNIHDVFPDSLVNAGLTHKGSIIYKIGRKIEQYIYSNATEIIAVSNSIRDNLLTKGVEKNKVSVIYNWVDENDIHYIPREKNKLVEKWKLDSSKFFVVYAGNLGAAQNIDIILDAARITSNNNNIQYLIIGKGIDEDRLKKKASLMQLHNVNFFPIQPYSDVSHVYSLGDVGIVTCKPGVGTAGMPSKTWSIMATGRPLIVSYDSNSELRNLVDKINAGLCVDPDNAEEFAKKVIFYYEHREMCSEKGDNGREYVNKNLTKNICVEKYRKVLMKVKGKNE